MSNYFYIFSGAAGKKNRQKERRLMKGFNLSSGGAGGSVTTPLGAGGLPSLSSQCSNPLPVTKKSSLTADIAIDLSGVKKSPMQR